VLCCSSNGTTMIGVLTNPPVVGQRGCWDSKPCCSSWSSCASHVEGAYRDTYTCMACTTTYYMSLLALCIRVKDVRKRSHTVRQFAKDVARSYDAVVCILIPP
jgi:hypothetical protein